MKKIDKLENYEKMMAEFLRAILVCAEKYPLLYYIYFENPLYNKVLQQQKMKKCNLIQRMSIENAVLENLDGYKDFYDWPMIFPVKVMKLRLRIQFAGSRVRGR